MPERLFDSWAGLLVGENDRGDDARGHGGQNIIVVHLAPFIATRRGLQAMAAIIHPAAAIPVIALDASALAPVGMGRAVIVVVTHIVLAVVVLIVVETVVAILGNGGRAGQKAKRGSSDDKAVHGVILFCAPRKSRCANMLVGGAKRGYDILTNTRSKSSTKRT